MFHCKKPPWKKICGEAINQEIDKIVLLGMFSRWLVSIYQ